jgi:hypothetical protein
MMQQRKNCFVFMVFPIEPTLKSAGNEPKFLLREATITSDRLRTQMELNLLIAVFAGSARHQFRSMTREKMKESRDGIERFYRSGVSKGNFASHV